MRFCGNCGAALDAAAISSGTCPTCGVALDPATVAAPPLAPPVTGDLQQTVLDKHWPAADSDDPFGPTVPLELRLAPNEPMALANARPNTARLARVRPNQPANPLTVIGLGVGLGLALLLVIACTLTFLTMGSHPSSSASAVKPFKTTTIGPTATDAGLGFATQGADPTPLPYTAPSPIATDTPYGGIPTDTPAPAPTQPSEPTATPTPDNGQATLVVSAPTCPAVGQGQFTIAATGNGSLDWHAASDRPAVTNISPSFGTVTGGQSGQPVTVTAATSVRVTVIANPGNQIQSVRINCVP